MDCPNIVCICASDKTPFQWMDNNIKKTINTCGIIIKYNNTQYIIASRNKIIYMKKITCYFPMATSDGKIVICKTMLDILYQSIEYDIVILVTRGLDYFNTNDLSFIIGHTNDQIVINGFDVNNIVYNTDFTNMLAVYVDISYEKNIDITQTLELIIRSEFVEYIDGYIPRNHIICYHNDLFVNNNNFGCQIIVDRDMNPHGFIVNDIEYNAINITAISMIHVELVMKCLYDELLGYNIFDYNGIACLPFEYNYKLYSNNNELRITKQTLIRCGDKNKKLFINDIIISINNLPIIITDNKPSVYDNRLDKYVRIEIYISSTLTPHSELQLHIKRKNNNINLICYPIKIKRFPLSSINNFRPDNIIPYLIINDLVIVSLSHELLAMFYYNLINIADHFINQSDTYINNCTVLVVIDSIHDNYKDISKLPNFYQKECDIAHGINTSPIIYDIPFIYSINNSRVFTLNEAIHMSMNTVTNIIFDKKKSKCKLSNILF